MHPRRRNLFLGATLGLAVSLARPSPAIESPAVQIQSHGSNRATPRSARPPTRWHAKAVTIVLDPSLGDTSERVENALENALRTWQDTGAALPEIHVTHASSSVRPSLEPDGLNSLLLAAIEFPGHETDLAVTVGFSDSSSGELSEADIVLNTRHAFVDGLDPSVDPPLSCDGAPIPAECVDAYDLENVLAHELGHFFGLGEDFEDPTATMYTCTSTCETHKRDLEIGDVDRILDLYADSDETRVGCSGAQMARGTTTNAAPWIIAFFLGGVAFGRPRVRQTGARTNAHSGGSRNKSDCSKPCAGCASVGNSRCVS